MYLFLFMLFLAVLGLHCCVGFSLVAASGGHSPLQCLGLSSWWLLLLRSLGSRRTCPAFVTCGLQSAGSVVVAHGPSRSAACGILPDQGSNPCPLHWQADSQPLRHQGSPHLTFLWWVECVPPQPPLCHSYFEALTPNVMVLRDN